MYEKLASGRRPSFKKLYANILKIHDANNSDSISKTTWSYSCYSSGEKVDDSIRVAYRKDYDVMFSVENPFELSNAYFGNKLKVGTVIKIEQNIV